MLRLFSWGALAALAMVPISLERDARACGGCFRPTQVVTAVNAHRMVFSVSPEQTVLWDQFTYSGNPQDFAWVLPVHAAGVQVQLAHDEFIAALDAWTAPVIRGPQATGGGGCSSNATSFEGPGSGGVTVINQQIVGPYEVATLAATDPGALENWLAAHGYEIPSNVQPTIAAYVAGGFDFIALRLQPGQGVAAMQPVRVVTSGADPTLPLRMVAAGVGADVSILLYVISEGRFETANFHNLTIDESKLAWDKNANSSNYDSVIKDTMTGGDGRNFVVEFAGHLFSNDPSINSRQAFTQFYYSGATQAQKCPYQSIDGPDFSSIVTNPFDASSGFGDASTSDGGASDGGGTLAAPYDQCFFDDLTTATQGMNRNDVFLTRLRADLAVASLDKDLVVQAAADQSPYDNVHNVTQSTSGCATANEAPDRGMLVVLFGTLAALFAWKRRAR